jgi:flagellin-specific chaperone FliS
MAKNPLFGDQLRTAVLNAEETRYRISKATGISESILSRFVHGEAGLSMENVNRLCDYLCLKLVKANKAKTSKIKQKGK